MESLVEIELFIKGLSQNMVFCDSPFYIGNFCQGGIKVIAAKYSALMKGVFGYI